MSAPAVPVPASRSLGGRARAGVDRTGGLVEAWLRGHTLLVYLFLYLPIAIVVIFSFNATERRVTDWDGFSLRWYEQVLASREIQRYLMNSVIVGLATAVIATLAGTMAALGLQRVPRRLRIPFDGLTYVSVIVPELVIALATLIFFASTIGRDGILTNITGTELGFGYAPNANSGDNACTLDLGVPLSIAMLERLHLVAFLTPGVVWELDCSGGDMQPQRSYLLGFGLGLQQLGFRGLDVHVGMQRMFRGATGVQFGVSVSWIRLP